MQKIPCSSYPFRVIHDSGSLQTIYPYIRTEDGDREFICLTPIHGRSFVVGKTNNEKYIVSKGNGLSYTQSSFLHTGEFYDGTWGLLLRQDAERDFLVGREVEAIGIKTNHMQYVLEIDFDVNLPNGHKIKPTLLQYDVECPYRICDAPFMEQELIMKEIKKWELVNERGYEKYHMIAANILINNLRILHSNNILHNAIHEQNYTWALELLDFELACSLQYPYTKEDYQRHVKDLLPREIIQTYVIINYIAGVLKEEIIFSKIDSLFAEYGFNLKQFSTK
ncbi:MAG: hypothetical protein IKY67_08620 [Paludibacteraceae bacterium]|nr:hypothetical protein [Paludibacteraceae bacterium]